MNFFKKKKKTICFQFIIELNFTFYQLDEGINDSYDKNRLFPLLLTFRSNDRNLIKISPVRFFESMRALICYVTFVQLKRLNGTSNFYRI